MSPTPKIAIIGAGPSGLTLARLLQVNDVACTVYEGEPDRHSRNQGGSLDLHAEYGLLALEKANLLDEVRKISRPEGDCIKLIDKDANILADENVGGSQRKVQSSGKPEVDRTALRDLLLDSLKPGTVEWSRKVERVEATGDNKHNIHFVDGSMERDISLVVGADGAFSKVRPLVTAVEPFYSGITYIELWALATSTSNPWLSNYVGAGSLFMFDEGRSMLCQRQSGDAIRTYLGLRKPFEWAHTCGIDWHDSAAVRTALASEYFGDCGDDIKRTITTSDDRLVLRHLWMLPVGIDWEAKRGVTVMGDAAHLMTPFAGVGVNAAMIDSLGLASAIIARKHLLHDADAIGAAIREYEKEMFPRATSFAKRTYDGLQHHYRATGGQEWAEGLKNGQTQ